MADNTDFDVAVSLFMEEHPLRLLAADLDEFLELTEDVAMPPAQRLRQLAIGLERVGARCRGWPYLQAIYRRAAELAPDDYTVFHSSGISALEWVDDWRRLEEARRVEIAAEAEELFSGIDIEKAS